jgi:hypothetical protein
VDVERFGDTKVNEDESKGCEILFLQISPTSLEQSGSYKSPTEPGLPHFSRYLIPKQVKCTK